MKDCSLSIFSRLQHTWGSNWWGCETQTGSPSRRAGPGGRGGARCSCKPLKASSPPRAAVIALLCVSSAHQRWCLLPSLSDLRGDELDGCQACGVKGGRRRVSGEWRAPPRGTGQSQDPPPPRESCPASPTPPHPPHPRLDPWRTQVEGQGPSRDGCGLSSHLRYQGRYRAEGRRAPLCRCLTLGTSLSLPDPSPSPCLWNGVCA